MKLDIAPEQPRQSGFKRVGLHLGSEVDFVVDLEKYPWSVFKDNSVEEINCTHYLERTTDMIGFMDELWRICQNGATVKLLSAYYASAKSVQDPRNKRGISEDSFLFFNKKWRDENTITTPVKSNFEIVHMLTFMNEPWNTKSDEAKQFAQRHYWNVVSDIYIELRAIK